MLKNISVSFGATIAIQAITMVGGILSARVLLPQGKGEFTAVMLWPTLIASLGCLGIYDAIAYYSANDQGHGTKKILASGMLLASSLSIVLMAIGYFVIPQVLSNYGATMVNTSLRYLWYIPLTLVTVSLSNVLLGKLRLMQYNILRTFVQLGNVLGMFFLYLMNQVSVPGFATAYLLSSFAALLLAILFVARSGWIVTLPDISVAKKLIAYGWRAHIGTVASIFNLRLDQLLLSIFLAPTILGLYVVAVTTASVASLAAYTIGIVAFSHIANLASPQAMRQAFGRFMRLALCLTLLSTATLFILAPWLIAFFFGAAYRESVDAARILAIAMIPLGCNVIFATGFKAFNRPLVPSKAELVGLSVTAVSLALLLPVYQALGAAWASLLAYSATCLFMAWQARVEMGLSLLELFLPNRADWNYVKTLVPRLSSPSQVK